MIKESGQSIGNVVDRDDQGANFSQKVQNWLEDEATYDEVRQSITSHDRPVIDRVIDYIRGRVSS